MKFGKRIKEQIQESLPEWRDKFLRYKELKNLISSPAPAESIFVGLLNAEIDKFNAFFVEQEEDFIIHHKVLKKQEIIVLEFTESTRFELTRYKVL